MNYGCETIDCNTGMSDAMDYECEMVTFIDGLSNDLVEVVGYVKHCLTMEDLQVVLLT